jgi:two-component system NarL family response regulator
MSIEDAITEAEASSTLAIGASPDTARLTRRELDVLRLLADGKSDREIAAELCIARPTASNHVAAILSKLGMHSRAAVAAYAVRHRLI